MEHSEAEVKEAIDRRLKSLRIKSNKEYFVNMISDLIIKKKIPFEVIDVILESPTVSGVTKFDRIYEVANQFAYPEYSTKIKSLAGLDGNIRIWKVNTPGKYKIGHILIKAETYQNAFALGCDYVSRVHLRLFHEIPTDLTIKVTYCSEKFLRKHYGVREINKKRQRTLRNTKNRTFSKRQISGLVLSALGHPPNDPQRSIARYHDKADKDILRRLGVVKTTPIEKESFYCGIDKKV